MENLSTLFVQYGLLAVFVSILVEQLGARIDGWVAAGQPLEVIGGSLDP